MELDVRIEKDSLSLPIENPFRLDMDSLITQIQQFLSSKGVGLEGMDIAGLIPRMIKGIAGCESGCPADAKRLVSSGYQNFTLEYIEGGILSARTKTAEGKVLSVKMFPDF